MEERLNFLLLLLRALISSMTLTGFFHETFKTQSGRFSILLAGNSEKVQTNISGKTRQQKTMENGAKGGGNDGEVWAQTPTHRATLKGGSRRAAAKQDTFKSVSVLSKGTSFSWSRLILAIPWAVTLPGARGAVLWGEEPCLCSVRETRKICAKRVRKIT